MYHLRYILTTPTAYMYHRATLAEQCIANVVDVLIIRTRRYKTGDSRKPSRLLESLSIALTAKGAAYAYFSVRRSSPKHIRATRKTLPPIASRLRARVAGESGGRSQQLRCSRYYLSTSITRGKGREGRPETFRVARECVPLYISEIEGGTA